MLSTITNFLLFDVPVVSSFEIAGGIIAFIILIVCAVTAFIVFTMMKRTLKMAFRLAIVGALLLIAVVGSVSIYWFMQGNSATSKRPAQTRPNR